MAGMVALMIEHRGVRCLACTQLDLQRFPDNAKLGYGICLFMQPGTVFERFDRSHNCTAYEPAPPETVAARDAWAKTIKLPAWQR